MRDPRYPSHSEPPLNKGLLEDFVRDKRLFVSHSPFRVYVYKNCIIIRFGILLFHSACKPDFAGYKPGLSSKETPTFLSLSAILEKHAYIRLLRAFSLEVSCLLSISSITTFSEFPAFALRVSSLRSEKNHSLF